MTRTRQRLTLALVAAVTAMLGGHPALAQQSGAIDASTRKQVIDGAIAHMDRAYIFEDVAARMAAALRAHMSAGAYDTITSGAE